MKLNIDCVRDVMLAVENAEYGERKNISALYEELEGKYTEEEIEYTCLKLNEGGKIEANLVSRMGGAPVGVKSVNDLTYDGHQFIDNIRKDSTWNIVKNKALKVGSFSIKAIASIAEKVVTDLIINS